MPAGYDHSAARQDNVSGAEQVTTIVFQQHRVFAFSVLKAERAFLRHVCVRTEALLNFNITHSCPQYALFQTKAVPTPIGTLIRRFGHVRFWEGSMLR